MNTLSSIPEDSVRLSPSASGAQDATLGHAADVRLDDQHPWPGLAPYNEAAQAYFKGRDDEAEKLAELISTHTVVSLYGKSGLGKSSLLLAGVSPRLRARGFLPVYARLNFTSEISAFDQLLSLLHIAIDAAGLDFLGRREGNGLWVQLHDENFELWTADNHPCTPVFILDQFEEVLSQISDPQSLASFTDRLGDLIENRIPSEIASNKAQLATLDVLRCRYRVVISFREDYLPDLRTWEPRLPSLLRQSMRLEPMRKATAVNAVNLAGHAVLDAGVAEQIVDFVANRRGASDINATIEPVMLSLCCTQLNRKRDGRPINAELLKAAGPNIIEDFYDQAMRGMPDHVHRFLEDHLVQGRVRGSYARDEALSEGFIDASQLEQLTSVHRLLRVEEQGAVARIELIHDRVVDIVRRARDARRAQESANAAQREEDLLRQHRAKRRIAIALSIVSVFAAIAVGQSIVLVRAVREAKTSQALAEERTKIAATLAGKLIAQQATVDQGQKQLSLIGQYGWAGNPDPKLYENALQADDAIRRLLASPTSDAARRSQTTLQIFEKDIDQSKVQSALQTLGFKVIVLTSKLSGYPTNAVFFGTGAQLDDVKLVALALMRSGIAVQWINRIEDNIAASRQAVIQAGATARARNATAYTAADVANANAFTGLSPAANSNGH